MTGRSLGLLAVATLVGCSGQRPAARDEVLAFSVEDGATQNLLYRRGKVAAHVLATSGERPRLVVAFPAGNTGIGVWFAPAAAASLRVEGDLSPVERDHRMRGVRAVLAADARELPVDKEILGNVNSVREWVPPGLTFQPLVQRVEAGPPAQIARVEIDGRHHIEIRFRPLDGGSATVRGDRLTLAAAPGAARVRFEIEAATDEEPLRPIPMSELLVDARDADPALLRALAFLPTTASCCCRPPPPYLEEAADRILLPFPAGLRTPVGIVVANPAYAGDLEARFTTAHYHGTVVWSWQQAMLAAGLARQLDRNDLSAATLEKLRAAQSALWSVIEATRGQGAGELWTFAVVDGAITFARFGQRAGDVDESNAAQLWSTADLAVKPPPARERDAR